MTESFSKSQLAPEFRKLPNVTLPSSRLLLRTANLIVRFQRRRFTWGDEVRVQAHDVESDTGHVTPVVEIAPRDLDGAAPALLDLHGGGFFLTHMEYHLELARRYALEARCRVFFPDYRLSIDDPFPAGFDDCYSTLSWMRTHASDIGIDTERVVILGDSAGGALAAGVTQKAVDRGENPVCGQILIYPVTDHEMKTGSIQEFTNTPMWKTANNRTMWKLYLRATDYAASRETAPIAPYAAPLHRADFVDLPPALIETAEFDPLKDEALLYAAALKDAGVVVEAREAKGAVHGFEAAEHSAIVEYMIEHRVAALRRFFGYHQT